MKKRRKKQACNTCGSKKYAQYQGNGYWNGYLTEAWYCSFCGLKFLGRIFKHLKEPGW